MARGLLFVSCGLVVVVVGGKYRWCSFHSALLRRRRSWLVVWREWRTDYRIRIVVGLAVKVWCSGRELEMIPESKQS